MQKYLLLIGAPGSGKGTQGALLAKKYGLFHLSTGNLFRAEIEADTPFGKIVKHKVDNGHLVPDDMTHKIVVDVLSNIKTGILFDGYPRNVAQAEALDAYFGKNALTVYHLDVPLEELKKRLHLRSEQEERLDDKDAKKVTHRLEVYEQETVPMLAYYHKQQEVRKFRATGDISEIFTALCEQIDQSFT